MTGPAYAALLACHVASVVAGFGALVATGLFARRMAVSPEPRADPSLRRYFREGTNWVSRAVLVVPVFGALLLATGDRRAVGEPWPWIGLGAWLVAAVTAARWCWPAEAGIQRWLARPDAAVGPDEQAESSQGVVRGSAAVAAGREQLRADCSAAARGGAVVSICFVVALVVMVGQPR